MERLKLLGDLVAQRRKELNLTQQQLADKTGIQRPYLTQIEKGYPSVAPSEEVLARLATALGVGEKELRQVARLTAFLLKPPRRTGTERNQDLLVFNCITHQIRGAERNIKVRSFSCLTSLLLLRDDLRRALSTGRAIQVLLAQPTLPNVLARIDVSDLAAPGVQSDDELVRLVHHYQLRHETALSLLRNIWSVSEAGNLSLHMFEQYTPPQLFIFDDSVAIEVPKQGEVVYADKDDDPRAFNRIARRFTGEWQAALSYDWNPPIQTAYPLLSQEEILAYRKAKATAGKAD